MNLIENGSTAGITCISCDSTAVQTTWVDDKFEYGNGPARADISTRIPVRHCISCSSTYMDEEAESIRHAAICKHLRIMPPTEITALRLKYGMTQQQLADLSRLGRASLARWETGALFQNPANDNLLFLLTFSENIDRIKRRAADVENLPKDYEPKNRFRALNRTKLIIAKKESQRFQLHA